MGFYKEVSGMHFCEDTSMEVCDSLVKAANESIRVRLYYGDVNSGLSDMTRKDTVGYLFPIEGKYRILHIKRNYRGKKGVPVFDNRVVGIYALKEKTWVYKHKDFSFPKLLLQGKRIMRDTGMRIDGEVVYGGVCMCETEKEAKKKFDYYMGKRHFI